MKNYIHKKFETEHVGHVGVIFTNKNERSEVQLFWQTSMSKKRS